MERTFKEAFQEFAKKALTAAGRNPALAEFPLAVSVYCLFRPFPKQPLSLEKHYHLTLFYLNFVNI